MEAGTLLVEPEMRKRICRTVWCSPNRIGVLFVLLVFRDRCQPFRRCTRCPWTKSLTRESRFDSRLQIRGGGLEPRRSDRGGVAYFTRVIADRTRTWETRPWRPPEDNHNIINGILWRLNEAYADSVRLSPSYAAGAFNHLWLDKQGKLVGNADWAFDG
jgi:hypothetical protein